MEQHGQPQRKNLRDEVVIREQFAIFDSPPRQPSTSNANWRCSCAEKPGMSAFSRMYAPCLWNPICDTV